MATTITPQYLQGSDYSVLSQAEAIWKTNPDQGGTGAWDTMPVTDFAPNYNRTRQRPGVIRNDQQGSPEVTTQIACAPAITVPFTRTVFNPWLSALINQDHDALAGSTIVNSTVFQAFHLIWKRESGDNNYVFPGCWPNAGTLTLATGNFSTFAFNWFSGKRGKIALAGIGDPITPAPTTPIFSPVETTTTVVIGGMTAGAGSFSSTIVLTKDGAENLYVIGNPESKSIATGALIVTGALTLYLEGSNTDVFDAFDGESKHTLTIQVRDNEAKGYNFSLPEVVLTSHDDPISGAGPISCTANYSANPNPHTIQIQEIT